MPKENKKSTRIFISAIKKEVNWNCQILAITPEPEDLVVGICVYLNIPRSFNSHAEIAEWTTNAETEAFELKEAIEMGYCDMQDPRIAFDPKVADNEVDKLRLLRKKKMICSQLKIEAKLDNLNIELIVALQKPGENVNRVLDKLKALKDMIPELTPIILKKSPSLVLTVYKVLDYLRFCGEITKNLNEEIKEYALNILDEIKQTVFEINDDREFSIFFSAEVEKYCRSVAHLSVSERYEIINERELPQPTNPRNVASVSHR